MTTPLLCRGLRLPAYPKKIMKQNQTILAGDLRDTIFVSLGDRQFTAEIRVRRPGVVCGLAAAQAKALDLSCDVLWCGSEGGVAAKNEVLMRLKGTAKTLAQAEDLLPGIIAKPTGIARAAARAVELAQGRVRIVSGAVKKMPQKMKPLIRMALICGGAGLRITDAPFVYLDKNYVRMFGGVGQALEAVAPMGLTRAIQLRGELQDLATETRVALDAGAEILMIDTGDVSDLDLVAQLTRESGRRPQTKICFAGDIAVGDVPELITHDVDILGIGRAIIDAPLADLKMDVSI